MSLVDIYVLLETFSEREIVFFRENYLDGFIEGADYYEYSPEFKGKIEFETESIEDMIAFMLQGNKGYFRFYFRCPDPIDVFYGMIFFNVDNTVVLGVGVLPKYLSFYESKLKNDFKSELIMICNEVPPPNNSIDFKKIIN